MSTPARPRAPRFLAISAIVIAGTTFSGAVRAAVPEDCPPGSIGKDEGGFQWCEPTVCLSDADCGSSKVCRSMPLCVEVGSVSDGAAGKRLVVHNRCAGEKKECPAQTTCLEGKRCIDKSAADRMGILVEDAGPPAEPSPRKSVCGCSVPGVATTDFAWLGVAGIVGVSIARRRKRSQ